MQISDEQLNKFILIYRRTYHKDISIPDARILATNFLNLMKVICRPIGDEEGLDEKNIKS